MSTPFILDYFRVAADSSDRPTNPNNELEPDGPGTSPEAITFRFEQDTKTFLIWNPGTETYITVRTSEDAVDAADVDYDNSGSGLASTNVKDALDELSLTVAGSIAVEDEAINLTSAVTKFNFAGAGVTATEPVANEILVTIPGYTDEQAQDAVGGIFVDGTTINFTYDDGTPSITAEIQNIATTHFAANVVDTDGTLAANSDTRLASQKAVKTYVDAHAVTPAKVLISEVVTSGSQSSVTFSSIASTYRDLEVRVRGRCSASQVEVDIRMQFNADTGATNYQWSRFYSGAGTFSAQDSGDPSIWCGSLTGGTGQANGSSCFTVDIMNYKDTTWHKEIKSHAGLVLTNNDNLSFLASGVWKSTSAINEVKVFPSTGNFVDNCVVSLYGHY